jgi:con80 domain of Katanin
MLPKPSGFGSANKSLRYEEKRGSNEDVKEVDRKLTSADTATPAQSSRYPSQPAPASSPPSQMQPSFKPSFPPKYSSVRTGAGVVTAAPEALSIVGVNRNMNAPPQRIDYIQQRNGTELKPQKASTPSSSSHEGKQVPRVVERRQMDQHDPDCFGRDVSAAAIEELLDEALESSAYTIAELSQRLATLKTLRSQWEQGDIIQVISHLQVIFDEAMDNEGDEIGLVVLADFLQAIELRGNGLNLDACVQLLPIFESMVNECMHIEHVLVAAINSASMLCEAFGDLIRQTRAVVITGVDLSREERLKKCNSCHASLFRIKKRLEMVTRDYHKKNSVKASPVLAASKRLTELIHDSI